MDLKKFRQRAARKKEKLSVFLDVLDHLVPDEMPEIVERIDATVWADVNCMECANCCKTMTPTFSKADVIRIAAHLQISPKEFQTRWLKKEDGTGDWVNINQPCQFLIDNKCSIYEVRPVDCAEFPHHNKRPFDLYNETFKNNLTHCPATLTLIDRLRKEIEREYEWPS